MKTLTEFATLTLKNAAKTRQELLAAGKTPEELPQAMGEALKLEGDKLTFLMNALEVVGDKLEDLKRVVVFTLGEGAKPTGKAVLKGEQYYSTEYYPSLNPQKARGPREEKGRDGKRGDRKGKRGGRGGRDGGRDGRRGEGRGPGRSQEQGERIAAAPGTETGGEGEKRGGRPPKRGPRRERPESPDHAARMSQPARPLPKPLNPGAIPAKPATAPSSENSSPATETQS